METDTVELNPTECPICHETYKVPKILPCAHLLCRDCLVTWMKTNSNAQCLVCCSAIRNILDTEPTTCEEYADSLTTDHSMTSVIESANMFNQQRVCYVHTDLTAAFICLQCGVMLCAICEEVHRKLPMSASHRIEELATLTLEILANSRQVPCMTHSDKPTELFCPTHNIPICNICASTKHRACPEMIDLRDTLKQLKQTLSELKIELTAAESEFSKLVTKYEEQLAVSDATTNRLNSEIDQVCDRIQSSLEAYRQRLKRRVLEEVTVVQESARAGKALLGHKSGRVTSHLQLLRRVEQYAPDTYLFLMTKMLSSRVKELELDATLPAAVNPVSTLSLVVDENALKRVEQTFCTILHLKTIPLCAGAEQNVWRFHMNHGKNVVLSNNGHTAESSSTRFGVVMSEEAMVVNRLYEVKVEEIREERMREIMIGVILEDTTVLHDLKYACGMDTTIAILNNGAIVFKNWNVNTSCPGLLTVKVGSHLGVLIDSAYCLHIYIDGKDQGVVVRYVRQPCYAMFDLYSCLRKITTLAVTNVP